MKGQPRQLQLPGLAPAADHAQAPIGRLFAAARPLPRCSIPGCDEPHYGRGFCRRHWRQATEGKDPGTQRQCRQCETALGLASRSDQLFCTAACKMRYYRQAEEGCYRPERVLAARGACSISTCVRPVHAHGFCQFHENRRVRHGNPLYEAEPRGTLLCCIPNCGLEHLAGGYCRRHYTQQHRHGDPLHAKRITAKFLKQKAHPLNGQWRAMLSRCTNPKAANYVHYGARGITVCERWRENFWAFVVDVGPRERDTDQLHRINNDGHYEPGNVAWVSPAENSRARSCNVLTAEGADEIRRRRQAGETQDAIAQALGVTLSTVHDVLSGRTWNDGDAPDMRIRRHRPADAPAPDTVTGGELRRDPLYQTCAGIKARCLNPKSTNYAAYGRRGITLYQPWAQSMRAFVEGIKAEIGPRPSPSYSIDRIDNDRGYEPGNLRWATRSEQLRNRRPRPPKV